MTKITMNPVHWVSKKINTKKPKQYRILTFPTHEAFQTNLSKTGHLFYLLNLPDAKTWDTRYRPLPENCFNIRSLNPHYDFDFILSQEKFGQLQYCLDLQVATRLPIIHLEHVEPQKDRWSRKQFEQFQYYRGDLNVFITEHNKQSWEHEDGVVIRHGLDRSFFSDWNGSASSENIYVLYVVNHLQERDYFCGYTEWQEIRDKVQEKRPDVHFKLLGYNGDLGSPAKNLDELRLAYKYAAVYLNTSKLSPIPLSLLEAMSTGCPVVTTANQEVPKVIQHGDNGFCSNDTDILANSILQLLEDKELSYNIGKRGQETVDQEFSLNSFVEKWNSVFDSAYELQYGKACLEMYYE